VTVKALVKALVDSGAYIMAINEELQQQFGLPRLGEDSQRYFGCVVLPICPFL